MTPAGKMHPSRQRAPVPHGRTLHAPVIFFRAEVIFLSFPTFLSRIAHSEWTDRGAFSRSRIVLGLFLIFVLLWVALAAGLWIGAMWLQGTFYNEVEESLLWRAPVAAAVVVGFYFFWAFLDYRSPGDYPGMFLFPITEYQEFDELIIEMDGAPVRYEQRTTERGTTVYADARYPIENREPGRSKVITAIRKGENGAVIEEVIFEADLDADGNYKVEPNKPLVYREKDGSRTMDENNLGLITIVRWRLIVVNLFLNTMHFVVWLLCLWLLVRFQFWHAFGLAFILWIAMTVLILPLILDRVEAVASRRMPPEATTRAVKAIPHIPLAEIPCRVGNG